MDPKTLGKWKKESLWSEKEFQELCCGLTPGGVRSDTEELNAAAESIKRAILSKDLNCICPSDPTAGDKLYGHARFFKPAEAIKWAAPRFSKFPFSAKEQDASLGAREEGTLLKLVIGMAIGGYKFDPKAEKNSATSDIAKDLKELDIPVTDETILKWLRKAAEAVLPANTLKF